MERMKAHAEHFERRSLSIKTVVWIAQKPIRLYGDNGEYTCDALIIATGASARSSVCRLNNPSWVTACVLAPPVMDSFTVGKKSPWWAVGIRLSKKPCILSNICSKVTLIHRRDAFRAEKILVSQLMKKMDEGESSQIFL